MQYENPEEFGEIRSLIHKVIEQHEIDEINGKSGPSLATLIYEALRENKLVFDERIVKKRKENRIKPRTFF
jgi:hypothetical protein